MFEYTITYYEVKYFMEQKGDLIEGPAFPIDPNPESLYENELYLRIMNDMGEQGWELVTVTPLLRACYHQGYGFGFPLTAGYYFYWKRTK